MLCGSSDLCHGGDEYRLLHFFVGTFDVTSCFICKKIIFSLRNRESFSLVFVIHTYVMLLDIFTVIVTFTHLLTV